MSNHRLSNPYWASCYDELITFYPRYYKEVFEMDAILRAHGGLADDLLDGAEHTLSNFFIDEMDEATIRSLEKWLDISLTASRTLEERRRLVKSFFIGMGKISATAIAEMIRAYTGADTYCEFLPFDENGNNRLYINFDRGDVDILYWSDIMQLLKRRIPAHIEYRAAVVLRFPIGVERGRSHVKYGYDFAGTKPETVMIASIHDVDAVTDPDRTNALMNYQRARSGGADPEAGLYPQIGTRAHIDVIDAATEAMPLNSGIDYIPCGTMNAHS